MCTGSGANSKGDVSIVDEIYPDNWYHDFFETKINQPRKMKIPVAKKERMGFPTSLVDLCFVARTHVDMRRSTSSELVVVLLMRRGKQRKKDFKNAGLGLEDQSFCRGGLFSGTWNSLLNCKPVWD